LIVLVKRTLSEFAKKNPSATVALNSWYDIVREADWSKPADIKQAFNNVDYAGNDRYIFNIKGNDFRLVAMIFFDKRTLFVRFIGTHSEYDRIDCSTI
jgi:mRNA interferase HigB